MKKKSRYTKEEKISLLKEYVESGMSQHRFCLVHGIPVTTFYPWRQQFGVATPIRNYKHMRNEVTSNDTEVQQELERLRREKKQLELELQRTKWKLQASELMIDLAESTYHIKVRKNSGAK